MGLMEAASKLFITPTAATLICCKSTCRNNNYEVTIKFHQDLYTSQWPEWSIMGGFFEIKGVMFLPMVFIQGTKTSLSDFCKPIAPRTTWLMNVNIRILAVV